MNQEKQNLRQLLYSYRIPKEQRSEIIQTHTSLKNIAEQIYPGSFHIPPEKRDEFNDAFYHRRFVENGIVHITEAHSPNYSPILIDIDLRFEISSTQNNKKSQKTCPHKYSFDIIIEIVSIYKQLLEEYIDLDDDEKQMAFIFEKSSAVIENGIIKDGVHIIFPYLSTDYELQFVLRHRIINHPDIQTIFTQLGTVNSLEDIFDKSVIKQNNWFMYGSSKPNKEPYKLTNVLLCDGDEYTEHLDEYADNNRDLINILSIYRVEMNIGYNDNVNINEVYEALPNSYKASNRARGRRRTTKGTSNTIESANTTVVANNQSDEDQQFIIGLVKCLSAERADNFDSWIRVGWCLHNINIFYLPLWKEFSQQSSKYEEEYCDNEWNNNMHRDGLHLGSLRLWAREDNPEEFKRIINKRTHILLEKCTERVSIKPPSVNCTIQLAKYIKEKYGPRFVCASYSKDLWYEFKYHKWNESDKGISLDIILANDLQADCSFLAQQFGTLGYEAFRAGNMDQKSMHEAKEQKLKIILTRLGKGIFRRDVKKDCSLELYQRDFCNKLDTNINLLHFNNGVYELETDVFREGLPEDMISMSTNIDWVYKDCERLSDEDEEIEVEIFDFLDTVFPDKEVRDYVLTLLASCLSGQVQSEKFHFLTGTGSNGKSVLIELVEKTLGDYAGKISTALITHKRGDAERPSPALAKLRGKRLVTMQEPEGDDTIKVGFMKELTGGDKIQARELNKPPIEFKPQFKLIMTCNDIPDLSNNDDGVKRRVRVVPFEATFKRNPNPQKKNEFKIDTSIKYKLDKWAPVFMTILIEYWKIFRERGLEEPEKVKITTEKYHAESDIYCQFVEDHIQEDLREKCKANDVFKMFIMWYQENSGDRKHPKKNVFMSGISRHMGKPIRGFFKGYSIKESIENAENRIEPMDDSDSESGSGSDSDADI